MSVSNKFVSWDVASSEVVRDIDPKADGMMMAMDLSKDSRFAAAFTKSVQTKFYTLNMKLIFPNLKRNEVVRTCYTFQYKPTHHSGHHAWTFRSGGEANGRE